MVARGAGDVNGDGVSDLLIGNSADGVEAVYVVYGRTEGFPSELDLASSSPSGGLRRRAGLARALERGGAVLVMSDQLFYGGPRDLPESVLGFVADGRDGVVLPSVYHHPDSASTPLIIT